MSSQAREPWKARRASAVEAPGTGANRKPGVEARAERAREAVSEEAKEQAGNIDPGMVSAKAGAVAGERKAVTSDRSPWKKVAASLEALIRPLGKTAVGELRGESSGASA